MLLNTKLLQSQGMGGIFLFRNLFPGKYVKDVFILWAEREERDKKRLSFQVEYFSEISLVNVNARPVRLTSENHGILPAEPGDLTSWRGVCVCVGGPMARRTGSAKSRRAVCHVMGQQGALAGSTSQESWIRSHKRGFSKCTKSRHRQSQRCQPTDSYPQDSSAGEIGHCHVGIETSW